MLIGYDHVDTTPFVSYFSLACVPGVTVEDISRVSSVALNVTAPGSALSSRESTTRKEEIMRVFVTGATGALGRHLVPGLIAAGHEVTATTRTPGKVAQLREAGAVPVVLDGLDREAVIAAVRAAAPEDIMHEMSGLSSLRGLRHPDQLLPLTRALKHRGT